MKYLFSIFILVLLFSCVNRKKDLSTNLQQEEIKKELSSTENQNLTQHQSNSTQLAQFLENTSFKINSNGQNYQLNYNGLVFSGSADLEFNKQKSQTITKTILVTKTTYKSQNIYRNYDVTRTLTKTKDLHVKAERSVMWERLFFFISGIIITLITLLLIKKPKLIT